MTNWHAHVSHMAIHMKMVGGPLWWGPRAPWPPLNPALRPTLNEQVGSHYAEINE